MLQKLQNKWKVTAGKLVLIIATFAIGGSLCGYIGRKMMGFTSVDQGISWVMIYVLLVTLLWPICVILISIPLGQFLFFKKYIKNIFTRIGSKPKILNAVKEKNINTL